MHITHPEQSVNQYVKSICKTMRQKWVVKYQLILVNIYNIYIFERDKKRIEHLSIHVSIMHMYINILSRTIRTDIVYETEVNIKRVKDSINVDS